MESRGYDKLIEENNFVVVLLFSRRAAAVLKWDLLYNDTTRCSTDAWNKNLLKKMQSNGTSVT